MITLEEFIDRFQQLKTKGWIKSHRSGNTGIGKTLEDELGIKENNIQGPDFGKYELKSMRKNANSMLTLITKSPDEPEAANTKLRLKFGYSSSVYDNNEKVLHATLSATRYSPISSTGHSLKVSCSDDKISVVSENGEIECSWDIETLKAKLESKLGSEFVFVRAESRMTPDGEEFLFDEAYLLDGFDSSGIIKLVNSGEILVDLRIGQYHSGANRGKTHDHGTGLRIQARHFHLIFKKKRIV